MLTLKEDHIQIVVPTEDPGDTARHLFDGLILAVQRAIADPMMLDKEQADKLCDVLTLVGSMFPDERQWYVLFLDKKKSINALKDRIRQLKRELKAEK